MGGPARCGCGRRGIGSGAQIVTNSLRDFPAPVLPRCNVEARTPDDFVIDQLDLAGYLPMRGVAQAGAVQGPGSRPKRLGDGVRVSFRYRAPDLCAMLEANLGHMRPDMRIPVRDGGHAVGQRRLLVVPTLRPEPRGNGANDLSQRDARHGRR